MGTAVKKEELCALPVQVVSLTNRVNNIKGIIIVHITKCMYSGNMHRGTLKLYLIAVLTCLGNKYGTMISFLCDWSEYEPCYLINKNQCKLSNINQLATFS